VEVHPAPDGGAAGAVTGDGLARDGATLYAVAGGRIARVGLEPGYERGRVRDTFAHQALLYPATLRKADDRLLVANSQVNAFGRPVLPFTIASIPVPA